MAKKAKKSARKSSSKKPARKVPADGRLALNVVQAPPPKPKPKSNFCEDHGRLLRADRTCPVSTCRFHTKPMP